MKNISSAYVLGLSDTKKSVLPSDTEARKNIPLARGVLDYFPAALAEVAKLSQAGNDKHNPGEDLHWARGKSMDHADCILRHLADRGTVDAEDGIRHSAKIAWRALALLQEELEKDAGAALPRGARVPDALVWGGGPSLAEARLVPGDSTKDSVRGEVYYNLVPNLTAPVADGKWRVRTSELGLLGIGDDCQSGVCPLCWRDGGSNESIDTATARWVRAAAPALSGASVVANGSRKEVARVLADRAAAVPPIGTSSLNGKWRVRRDQNPGLTRACTSSKCNVCWRDAEPGEVFDRATARWERT